MLKLLVLCFLMMNLVKIQCQGDDENIGSELSRRQYDIVPNGWLDLWPFMKNDRTTTPLMPGSRWLMTRECSLDLEDLV